VRARRLFSAVGAIAVCLVSWPVGADQLVLIPSTTTVSIASNYVGASIAVFGAVSTPSQEPPDYDAVITVTGPRQTLIVRRKRRMLGIWVNADSRTFADIPSFLFVLSNRPLNAIATTTNPNRNRIGLEQALALAPENDRDRAFGAALIDIESERGVYSEKTDAITFFSPTVFRADVAVSSNALIGAYDIDAKLFSKGELVAHSRSAFELVKTGTVQFIAAAARNDGLLYGFSVALMALGMGWLASIVFQRE